MKTLLLMLPIVYLTAVAQSLPLDLARIGRVEPDLLAMVAMIWVLMSTRPRRFLAAGWQGPAH